MTYRDTFAYGGKKFSDLLDSLNATKIGKPFTMMHLMVVYLRKLQ